MMAALSMGKLDAAACAQVSVLDGNKYTTMCREAGEQCLEILEECTVRYIHATVQRAARLVNTTPCPATLHGHLCSQMLHGVL